MTDDNEAKPEELPEDKPEPPSAPDPHRRMPRKRDDSEAAIGLEMARLFGMNPKTMMAPKSPPKDSPESSGDDDDEFERD
ncbi:MAG TPA: hypothetical protein VJS45_05575 [Acidimicrobiia bacterium]|jgi:hypothetical protein|nr:hypothetical protein [Acidimicrobiia bacterium]